MHKIQSNSVAACFVLIALTLPAIALSADETKADGRALYVRYQCWQCHGYEAQGGAAPRLANKEYSFQAFARFVRFPGLMPAYTTELLSDEKLQRIFGFIQSLPAPPDADTIPALRD